MKFKLTLLAASAMVVVARAFADDNPILTALAQLDPKNDAHWTANGEPRIDTVKALTGDQTITRDAINKAAPDFNREKAGGENRTGSGTPPAPPAPPASHAAPQDPMAAAQADGWVVHPDAAGFHYRGQEVVADAELATRYGAPSSGGQQAGEPSDQAQDISRQTGLGSGATTARSPAPVEGELRQTHVSLPSDGEPGERPAGVVQGMTDAGENKLGTPPGPAESADRTIDLSGEIQARNAGSTLSPTHAPADASNAEGISLGGAADPVVEARAPGGAVVAEGARPAAPESIEGPTVGGPFGSSDITAGDVHVASMDANFDGDPEKVAELQAELDEASAHTADIRSQVDNLTTQLNDAIRREADLRRQIAANQPRAGNMHTIQTFLRSAHERRVANIQAAREAGK